MRAPLWWLVVLLLTSSAPLYAQEQALAGEDSALQALPAAAEPVAEAPSFAELVAQLPTASYREKERLIHELVSHKADSTRALLEAFLAGQLFVVKDTGQVLIRFQNTEQASLVDAATGMQATAGSPSLKKIRTNNRLRKALKGALAQLDLANNDPVIRLAAVAEIQRGLDEHTIGLLRAHLVNETNASVSNAILTALATVELESSDPNIRLAAVRQLRGELNPEIYNRLQAMYEPDANGQYAEPDALIRKEARKVAENIGFWRDVYGAIETLFFGLSLGSVLVLAAIGLAITFGVMGVINMAHGELIMLGAYTAYVMQLILPSDTTLALLLSIPAAFLVAGLVGVVIERVIVRHLYGRPLETLLATFGLSLILQQTVRSIFSPLNRSVSSPEFMSGTLVINDALSLTYNRLYIIIFTLIVFAALMLVLKRTSLGLKVRAVAQNRPMARALGVRADWVDAATFGLGAGIAGVAGVALSQLTNVGPNLGQAYIIDSFMVVVFGGVGNLWGTLIGGLSLGVANKLLEPVSGAVLAKILVLVFIILYIQRRPGGMFPQSGRAADSN